MANRPNGIPKDFTVPPLAFTYRTYRLDPKSPNLPFLAGKFSSIALRALTTDPGSFGMAYLQEASFTPAEWIKRVSRPNVHIFICVAHPSTLSESLLGIENGDWVGMVTQIGPTPKDVYWLPEAGAEEPLADALETKWHQTATWIDPAHRGRGVAKQIIEAGLQFATESIQGSVVQARVRAFTGPQNDTSKSLYGGRGFPAVGLCTVGEAVKGNGNAEFGFHGRRVENLPAELRELRLGVVMERVVRKGP
jgi:GNAT superfamily N-acetyltransferase